MVASGNPTRGIGGALMPGGRPGPTMGPSDRAREEAEMVGIMFLYGIWAVLALGSIVVCAMALREHE
jgi:hypothetical protein